jgi:ribonuclease P protein component
MVLLRPTGMLPSGNGNRLPPRLTRISEFRRITRTGKRHQHTFLQLYFLPASMPNNQKSGKSTGRVGFVVPIRAIKSSVERNRVRRLLREALRHWWKHISPGYDIVLRVRAFPKIDHALFVEAVLLKLLDRAGILTDDGKIIATGRLGEIPPEYVPGRHE